jgi:glycosyltransferase involved in cell wall biosynthesis
LPSGRADQSPFPDPPRILPVTQPGEAPRWSVMIPAYNPSASHFAQALTSVLTQDPGPTRMQIGVVDDSSTEVDVGALVRSIAGHRVEYHRNPANLGLSGGWNACIERSRGTWVHILHQDDYVSQGFYKRIEVLAEAHPNLGLVASRSFILDGDGAINRVGPRLFSLENGGFAPDDFFYESQLHFPGVAVRRQCYEAYGGFRSDLTYALDCEMWARIIGNAGGLVMSEVLAFYRMHSKNQTMRLWKSGEAISDMVRINALFAQRYERFDPTIAERRLFETVRKNERWLAGQGDEEGARACRQFWRSHAPFGIKLEQAIESATSLVDRALSWGVRRLFKASGRTALRPPER